LLAGLQATKKKRETQATKQVISTITDKVESVKSKHTAELEKLRSEIQHKAIAKDEKRKVYKQISDTMLIFIQGGNSSTESIEKFHSNYQHIWLWAPDEVVKSLSNFLKLLVRNSSTQKNQSQKSVKQAYVNQSQKSVKQAYVNCLIAMRKDMGWDETQLDFSDYEFVNIRQNPNSQ